jgi:hypothetical protein
MGWYVHYTEGVGVDVLVLVLVLVLLLLSRTTQEERGWKVGERSAPREGQIGMVTLWCFN